MALVSGWLKVVEAVQTTDSRLLAAGAVFTVFTCVLYLINESRSAGLDHVPGPWLAKYTNLHAWIQAQTRFGTNTCYLQQLHEKYGDVVRVAPRRVSVCDPDSISAIYGMKASLDKSNLIRAAQPLGKGPDNLFSVRDAKSHAPMRRAVANAYSITNISQYEPRIDDTLKAFFSVLRDEYSQTNIGKWVHYYVYDVQGNMTYAEPLGYLEKRKDAVGLIWQTKLLLRYVQFTMPMPILHDIASFFIRTLRAQKATVFHHLSAQKVQERMLQLKSSTCSGDNRDKTDILAHFISSREKYPELMTQDQIIMHCMVNVVAGTGTSTTSIVNAIKYLVQNHDAQERLHKELNDNNITSPAKWRDLQSLPFLEGVVREGIRLRGSDGFNPLARVVGSAGLTLPDGSQLPPGAMVGVKPSVASVQAKTFGDHPREFLPDRWCRQNAESAEDFKERRARMDRGDMSFGSGTRGCIGRGIALMQIYKLLASLVLQYKLTAASDKDNTSSHFDFFCAIEPRD